MKGKPRTTKNSTSSGKPTAPESQPLKSRKVTIREPESESDDEEEEEVVEEEPEVKRGPPKKNKPKTAATALAKAVVDVPRSKELPYVEVPPLKQVARPVNTPKPSAGEDPPRPGPAYKTRAPVEEEADSGKILDDIMEMSVSVPLRSLLGSAPNVTNALKKKITKARQPVLMEEVLEDDELEAPTVEKVIDLDTLPIASFMFAGVGNSADLPAGYKVASDPFLQFALMNNGATPKEVYVAKDSYTLRSVYPKINGMGQEEGILDSGSQIVSMARAAAVELGLTWNPGITINMQSANKSVDRTLGLAENVPFRFGSVTVYLQVHIIESPAYRVLLGRPFDVLTGSTIENKQDGSQMVTITDPNTGVQAVMPTYARGETPEEYRKIRAAAF